jgi:hypothetical protein
MKIFLTLITALIAITSLAQTKGEAIPIAPNYADDTMWYMQKNDTTGRGADVFYIVSTWEFDWITADSLTCHYADTENALHRQRMDIEHKRVADFMAEGNNFYAPYYRHITLDSWMTQNEDTISKRCRIAMGDVKRAFDHFIAHRDNTRPLVLAGFSQGGKAVVELLKHMNDSTFKNLVAAYVLGYKVTPQDTMASKHFVAAKDSMDTGVTICYNSVKEARYRKAILCGDNVMCINPVNWRTDSTAAKLNDSVTVTMNPKYNVLEVKGYSGAQFHTIPGFINDGDLHSGEPIIYNECLRRNVALRIRTWREKRL